MPNTTAKHVLAEYLALPQPRYALLINAPWGAGKMEFVKKETNYEADPTFLYLSLFGIDSAQAFGEALLGAILRAPGKATQKRFRAVAEHVKNVVSGSQVMGFSINLSSLSVLEGLRAKLPATLIFDDLERSGMPQQVISGLLNQFIEHDKRRVVLIANTDQMRDKDTFDTTSEKLIGRRIEILPDSEAALQSYWVGIPAGRGKAYLQRHQEMIKSIFAQGGHGNLRLLRYALQATAGLLDKVDKELFDFEDALQKLAGTHLALHMAYSGGKIDKDALERRKDPHAFGESYFGKSKPEDIHAPLTALADAHPDYDINAINGPVLPVDLAYDLLVKGYVRAERLNDRLREIHHFQKPSAQPDWIRLWNWYEQSPTELETLLARTQARLEGNEITNMGEFIQIYAAQHFMARYDALEKSQSDLAKTFLCHIRQLTKAHLIPPRFPSGPARQRYVFGDEHGRISYGGYVFEPGAVSIRVVNALKAAMDKAYDKALPDQAAELLTCFEQDTPAFLAQISYDVRTPNFGDAPILHLMDKSRFAHRMLALVQEDRPMAARIAAQIKSRRANLDSELPQEHPWIAEMKDEMRACAVSRLHGAQIALFIDREL